MATCTTELTAADWDAAVLDGLRPVAELGLDMGLILGALAATGIDSSASGLRRLPCLDRLTDLEFDAALGVLTRDGLVACRDVFGERVLSLA